MNDTELTITLCEPDHTPLIVPLIQAQVAATGRPAPDPDALAEIVHALLISQFSDFVLARIGGRSVGVLQVNYRLSTWELGAYAVVEDFYLVAEARGQGVGTRMLSYACDRAEGRGARFIQAAARANDRAARRLYEAFNFRPTSQDLWRGDLPLGCAVDFDAPEASQPAEGEQ